MNTIKTISGITTAAVLMTAGTVFGQVVNSGFETASSSSSTGALGWTDTSGVPGGTAASATRSSISPYVGGWDLNLSYANTGSPVGGPAVGAQSDIFAAVAGAQTLSFEAAGTTIGNENNQVQVQWFNSGNGFLGSSGFQSYQSTLTGSYSLQSFSLTAPSGTAGAMIQFLEAGSAVPNDAGTTLIDNVSLAPVPEPTTLALAGLAGFMGLIAVRRRK